MSVSHDSLAAPAVCIVLHGFDWLPSLSEHLYHFWLLDVSRFLRIAYQTFVVPCPKAARLWGVELTSYNSSFYVP